MALPPLTSITSGNPNGPTLVFVHGWPDDHTLFEKMSGRLNANYFCVRVTLPNFGAATINPKGYGFEPIVAALTQLIIDTQTSRNRVKEPVSLVLHDWGCMYGYMLEKKNPELVKNVVALDIGYHVQPDVVAWVLLVLYQWYLIFAFLIGLVAPKAGDSMARAFAKLVKAPQAERVNAAMCYPYFYFWKLALTRSPLLKPNKARGLCPFPCLYLYGEKKPKQFHSDAFLFALSKRADSRVQGFPSGHWFLAGQQADEVNTVVAKWLDERYNASL